MIHHTFGPEPNQDKCWCDEMGIGKPGVSCGDCPTRDYAEPAQAQPSKPTTESGGEALTQDEIKELAKKAGGTPYVNRNFPGTLSVAFSGQALIEFVRLVEVAVQEKKSAADWVNYRQGFADWKAEAAQPAPKQEPIPEGYQFVPVDPTVEMLAVVKSEMSWCNPVGIYNKMLAAAPVQAQPRKTS